MPAPIRPGRAPPYRHPAACPHSWNKAEATVSPATSSRFTGSFSSWLSARDSPCVVKIQKSRAATLTTTAAITGQRNSGRKKVPAAPAARSGSRVTRALSASSGLAVGSTGAPCPATMPSGASLATMR